MKINLENFSFKSELEVYNQLKLIILSMEKRKDRRHLLDLASYWHKTHCYYNGVKNFAFNSFNNEQLELFIYKYIDKTFRSMIHRFNNSILLTITYASFLYEVLNKYSKAYIILYDLFFSNQDLSFSQSFYIYKIEKEIQEKVFEIGFDKTDISYKYQCNTLINLISQVSDIYINFWSLLLNSQEHQDINRLRDIGNKINEINERIEEQFEEIKKIKIKDKSIFTLYKLYKRDILNEISETQSDLDFLNLDEYFNQNIISLSDINSFISTSDFQFVICSGKEDNFGVILKISQEMCAHFGYSNEEVIGQHLNIFIPEFMRKKHDELLEDRISKIKLCDKISNSLKRHVFYFKTSSKYIFPISLDVCTIFDEDGKATIFGKVDYENIHIFHREISENCHIITNENLIIQTFSHNCLHILELSNSSLNGSVEITKFIKEFYSDFFTRITTIHKTNMKKIDKQKLKISILKEKYLSNQPEETITFGQKVFKMNVEELKLKGFLVGYIFHFAYLSQSEKIKMIKSKIRVFGKSKSINPKTFINIQENNTLGDIKFNYIPEVEKIYFDFENKVYKFHDKNLITINQYFNKELDRKKNNKKNTSQNSSSFNDSFFSKEEENSISSSSDFSSISSSFSSSSEEKNENSIHKSYTVKGLNNNYLHEFYKVNLSKISLSVYDYKTNILIGISKKTNSYKIEDLINKEKFANKKAFPKQNEEKNELNKPNEENLEKNNKIKEISSFKKRKNEEVQNLKKYYTIKLNNSIKYAFSFLIFHLTFVITSGILFFSICFKDRSIIVNVIELIKYLIKFGENSHSTLTYSFQLVLLKNPNYTNFFSERNKTMTGLRNKLFTKYIDCLNLLTSLQTNSISLSKINAKKMNQIQIYYYIIDDSLNVTQIFSNMKTMLSQYAYSIYNFANSDFEDIHFLNKDYNFIMLNSEDFFVDKINQYVLLEFEEYHHNLNQLEIHLWVIATVSLLFLIICLLFAIKTIFNITAEKEKLLRYFFGIDEDFIKSAINKCQKFIDLNKNNTFDSKYLISKPKIKIEDDIDVESSSMETSRFINSIKEYKNNTSIFRNKTNYLTHHRQLISDKQSLKENAILYMIYIGSIISFVLLLMIHNGKKYREAEKLLNIYYSVVLNKSIFIIAYNYLRIYILYSCSSFILYNSSTVPNNYMSQIYLSHQYYQELFYRNLTDYSLPKNSSYYFNNIIKGPLNPYLEKFASNYNINPSSIANNIGSYGINSLMIYYLATLHDLYEKIEEFIKHSQKTGFIYYDIYYGTKYYIQDFISDNLSEVQMYYENNPFQLFNDEQLRELNVLNEEIYKPAIETFIEALNLDINHCTQSIFNYIEKFSILYFIVIICFNCFFYIPYLFHKNRNINKVRQMLMIIPKEILYKTIEITDGKKEIIEGEW